jgi:hypothetical protein
MPLAQATIVATSVITALAGLLGTALGGWLTQRGAARARQDEEVTRARGSLLRLASILVTERAEDVEDVDDAAEHAAAAVMTLGYGSKTALAMLATVKDWRRFEAGSFPRTRARDETLDLLDRMLAASLPADVRPKDLHAATELSSAVRRPD